MKALILLMSSAMTLCAGSVKLAWDVPQDVQGMESYQVHYGAKAGEYTKTVDAGGLVYAFTLEGLEVGETYFVAITVTNIYGMPSPYSDEISVVGKADKPAAPTGLMEVVVEVSTNLRDWEEVATIAIAPEMAAAFYRARVTAK